MLSFKLMIKMEKESQQAHVSEWSFIVSQHFLRPIQCQAVAGCPSCEDKVVGANDYVFARY